MIERKYLAHFLDASFDTTYANTDYVRLGSDLEDYTEELNPQVEKTKNILGENSIKHKGYEPQSEVDPFYYKDYDDALSNKIFELVNTRAAGDKCKTSMVDVLLEPGAKREDLPTVVWAYREDVYAIPKSVGGDTSGIQTPFTLHKCGNQVKGTFDIITRKFTELGSEVPEKLSLND